VKDDGLMANASQVKPAKRFIRDIQQASERRHDLECDHLFKLDALLMKDRRETGCTRYVIFNECVGSILIWRDED